MNDCFCDPLPCELPVVSRPLFRVPGSIVAPERLKAERQASRASHMGRGGLHDTAAQVWRPDPGLVWAVSRRRRRYRVRSDLSRFRERRFVLGEPGLKSVPKVGFARPRLKWDRRNPLGPAVQRTQQGAWNLPLDWNERPSAHGGVLQRRWMAGSRSWTRKAATHLHSSLAGEGTKRSLSWPHHPQQRGPFDRHAMDCRYYSATRFRCVHAAKRDIAAGDFLALPKCGVSRGPA